MTVRNMMRLREMDRDDQDKFRKAINKNKFK